MSRRPKSRVFFSLGLLALSLRAAAGADCPADFSQLRSSNSVTDGDIASIIKVSRLVPDDPAIAVRSENGKNVIDFSGAKNAKARIDIPLTFSPDLLESWKLMDIALDETADQVKPYNYLAHPLSSAAVAQFRVTIPDSHKFLDNASFNFIVRGGDKPTPGRVFFETDLTDELGKKYGRPVRYVADVTVPGRADWISLRFSQFQLEGLPASAPRPSLAHAPQTPRKMALEVSTDQMRADGKNVLEVAKFFNLDLDLENDVDRFIDALEFRTDRWRPGRPFFERPSALFGETRDFAKHGAKIKTVIKKFFRSMEDPASQEYAVSLVRKGLPGVQAEMAKYGWTAKRQLKGKTRFLDVIENLEKKDIFFESGEFGVVHGRLAHHVQILAGLRGLSHEEGLEFLDFLSGFISSGGASSRWALWTALFDSRAEGVTSSRYWRDLLEGDKYRKKKQAR